jgi:hypothetical protein
MPDKCPRCGSNNIIGYMGEYECMDRGYRFKLLALRRWMGARSPVRKLIVIAVILVVLPWLILLLIPANAPTDVRNVFAGVSSALFIASGLYILFLILYAVLRIAFKK